MSCRARCKTHGKNQKSLARPIIFALVQNPKRVGTPAALKVSFQENHNRLFFLAEFLASWHD
jgi:hypothetical protein